MIPIRRDKKVIGFERTCPSITGTFPCEIYVAAFAIAGLDPGLYDYSSKEFSLRRIRDGYEALSLLKRGRPDLEFLKTTPGVILVSTIFARSAWRSGLRGYRDAVRDAGQMMENISICGNALGIQTVTRMRLTESTSRELIGIAPETAYDDAESVQAMIVWADPAPVPMPLPAGKVVEHLAPISRLAHPAPMCPIPEILQTQTDCVAPGVAVREIRPPLTELSPMPSDAVMVEKVVPEDAPVGQSLMRTLTTRRIASNFHRRSITRNAFLAMNFATFRGGSYFPLFADGPHVALIRPFWIVHEVVGVDSGVWYYHPPADRWSNLDRDDHRIDAAYIACEQPLAANAAAVCFMFANLNVLMNNAGPDLYRLAHLEAGTAAQRMYVAANSLNLGCAPIPDFYDDEVRKFLGLDRTGWEPIHAVAVGVSIDDRPLTSTAPQKVDEEGLWRD
jgi:SagB-type dehydrogenase family enzyme